MFMKIKGELFETSKQINIASKEVFDTETETSKTANLAKALVGCSLVAVKLSSKKDTLKDVKYTLEFSEDYGIPLVKLVN